MVRKVERKATACFCMEEDETLEYMFYGCGGVLEVLEDNTTRVYVEHGAHIDCFMELLLNTFGSSKN